MMHTTRTSIALWSTTVVLLTTSCGQGPVNGPQEVSSSITDGEEELPVDPNRIAVPATVRSNLGITFVTTERRRVEKTLRIPGVFEYLPSARREYRTMLPGRVELLVQQFEKVEEGQALFRLESPAWHEFQQQLAETESAIDDLNAELAAYHSLVAAHTEHEDKLNQSIAVLGDRVELLEDLGQVGGGRISELSQARSSLAAARVELAAAQEKVAELELSRAKNSVRLQGVQNRANLLLREMSKLLDIDEEVLQEPDRSSGGDAKRWRSLDTLVVTASQSGVVEELASTHGAWMEERALVIRVVQPKQLRFHAMGLQSDLGLLRDDLEVRIVPPVPTNANRAIGIQNTMTGRVTLGLAADPESRTVDLFATPTALADWARPGVSAQLEIITDSTSIPELTIPLAAVQQDGLEAVLFRRNPKRPDEVIRIVGDLGPNDGRWVTVLSGLRDGDEVVLDGSFQLMLATSGSMQEGGHFHADGTFHEGED